MSTKQFGRWQRAVAIVPLALLSAAWTANLAGAGVTAAITAESPQEDPLARRRDRARRGDRGPGQRVVR